MGRDSSRSFLDLGKSEETFSGVSMMLATAAPYLLLLAPLCSSQLIGSRGVLPTPEGLEYRDTETLQASLRVAKFAEKFQPLEDIYSQQNRLLEIQKRQGRSNVPSSPIFFSSSADLQNIQPVLQPSVQLFDFSASRSIQPPLENRLRQVVEKPFPLARPAALTSAARLPQYSFGFNFGK